MSSRVLALIAGAVAGGVLLAAQEGGRSMTQVRLMTLDPGTSMPPWSRRRCIPASLRASMSSLRSGRIWSST